MNEVIKALPINRGAIRLYEKLWRNAQRTSSSNVLAVRWQCQACTMAKQMTITAQQMKWAESQKLYMRNRHPCFAIRKGVCKYVRENAFRLPPSTLADVIDTSTAMKTKTCSPRSSYQSSILSFTLPAPPKVCFFPRSASSCPTASSSNLPAKPSGLARIFFRFSSAALACSFSSAL